MRPADTLILDGSQLPRPLGTGLVVPRGQGIHGDRTIDTCELIFVRQGHLAMWEAGRDWSAHAGQTLLLWPGRRHRGTEPYARDLEFYFVHFMPPRRSRRAAPLLHAPQLSTVRQPDRLGELFDHLLSRRDEHRRNEIAAGALVLLMLCEAADSIAPQASGAVPAALASWADTYIDRHFHEPISTASIASALGYNPDYLGRAYRRQTGRTLTGQLHRRRVRNACDLLLSTTLNVDRIARDCGFSEAGHFRQVFRRLQGMTPSAFRQLGMGTHAEGGPTD